MAQVQPQPAPASRWGPGYWSPIRILAVVATIATLVIGFVIIFSTFHNAKSLQDWIGAGIISAGVALGCVIIL